MLNREDIVLLFLDDPEKLVGEIQNGNLFKSDEIRTLICELVDPSIAFRYALHVDMCPHDLTRKIACGSPAWAQCYAESVDKVPRGDTRNASCKDPKWAYLYAILAEGCWHYETWNAVQKDPYWKDQYERWVKK